MVDVIAEAVRQLRPSVEAQDSRRAEIQQALIQLDGQIDKLTEAIAMGGPVQSLLGGIKDREHRREHIRADLASLEQLDQVAEIDLAVLTRDLEKAAGGVADLDRWAQPPGPVDPDQAPGRTPDLRAEERGGGGVL